METTTPDGYNTMEDILFEIKAEHDVNSPNYQLTQLVGGDKFTGTVVNKPGVKLPSTGGVGTTVFYIAGGILVLMSGAMLLIKKNKNHNA